MISQILVFILSLVSIFLSTIYFPMQTFKKYDAPTAIFHLLMNVVFFGGLYCTYYFCFCVK